MLDVRIGLRFDRAHRLAVDDELGALLLDALDHNVRDALGARTRPERMRAAHDVAMPANPPTRQVT